MVDFGVCPEGLRRVPVSTGAQFSLLQPDPKRAPKWEPKWSLLGSQIRTILTLGHHWAEIGAQKAASKNECRIWGGRGAAMSVGNWALDPLKDNARHPEPLQIRIKIEH